MDQSEDITDLATALATFQGEMTPVEKTANNPFFKSKYADLASVMKEAMPLTSKNGIAIVQFPGLIDGEEVLYTQLTHKTGQWMRSCMKLHLTKNDAQGQGSALTYAKRYAAMSALGIVADEDDDGNAASKAPKVQKTPKTAVPAIEFAKNWEVNNIKIAARKVIGNKPHEELIAWIEETLNIKLDKLPRAWVQKALDKINAMPELEKPFGVTDEELAKAENGTLLG